MAKSREIEHLGRVELVSDDLVKVNFISHSACGSCHSKAVCSVSEIQEKVVEVYNPNISVRVGEQVKIILQQTLGYKALFLGYVLPLILVLTFLIVFASILGSEAKAGLISLIALAIYYGILYLKRDSINKHFRFTIKKVE